MPLSFGSAVSKTCNHAVIASLVLLESNPTVATAANSVGHSGVLDIPGLGD